MTTRVELTNYGPDQVRVQLVRPVTLTDLPDTPRILEVGEVETFHVHSGCSLVVDEIKPVKE